MPADGPVEHPAQCNSINSAAVDAEPDDAAGELVHHYENPIGFQRSRFASEQIAAPQAVLRMAEKRQPGRASRIRFRPVMNTQDTADNILVDLDSEGQSNLLRNPPRSASAPFFQETEPPPLLRLLRNESV